MQESHWAIGSTVLTAMNPTIIEGGRRLSVSAVLTEYLEFGSLTRHLILRDIRLRYKHASLGALWVILQPLLPMLIFAAVFARVLRPSTGGVPYSLYALAGLVPWSFFSSSVSQGSMAFVSSSNLLTKVYFPRAILPASAILGSSLDFAIGGALLCAYSIWNGYLPRLTWLALPLFALQAILLAFLVSVGLATLTALYRDTKHAMQFLLQLWLYASPVAYSTSIVPSQYRWLFGLNPMTGVLMGFRWALLGNPVEPSLYWTSLATSLAIGIGSFLLFRHFEQIVAERV